MPSFHCDVVKKPVRNKELKQTGELTLSTTVKVGAKYQNGPVPVSVTYDATFLPDRQFLERSDCDPEERFEHYIIKSFGTAEERRMYCALVYEDRSKPAA